MLPETQKKLFVCKIEAVGHANKVDGYIERDGHGEDAIYTVTWSEEKLARIGEPWPSAKPTDSTVGDLIVKLKDQEGTITALQAKLASLRSRIFSKVDLDDAEKLLGQRFVDEAVFDQLKAENENLLTQVYRLENSISTMKRNREELKKIIAHHEGTIIMLRDRWLKSCETFKDQHDAVYVKLRNAEATIERLTAELEASKPVGPQWETDIVGVIRPISERKPPYRTGSTVSVDWPGTDFIERNMRAHATLRAKLEAQNAQLEAENAMLRERLTKKEVKASRTFSNEKEASEFCALVKGELIVSVDPSAGNGFGATVYAVLWPVGQDGDQ